MQPERGAQRLALRAREAAQTAEMILRRLPGDSLPAPVWIVCADLAVKQRLTNYLADVQAELIGR